MGSALLPLNAALNLQEDDLRISLLIASLMLFASGVYLSYLDKTGGATATYAAAVFCLIFVFLTEFRKFKGFGVEAELLERKIDEADKALKQLRDITSPIAEMLFSTVARSGRIGAMMPRRKRYELQQRIESELKSCGVSEAQIEKAKGDWHFFNIHDLSQPVFQVLSTHVDEFMGRELQKLSANQHDSPGVRLADHQREELSRLRSRIGDKDLPNEIINFIRKSEIFDSEKKTKIEAEISQSISELSYYIKNHNFNNLDEWFNGNQ